jgi:thymidylate synthase
MVATIINQEEQQYLNLLQKVLTKGEQKTVYNNPDKNLLSLFGETLTFDLSNGNIPIFSTKSVYWRGAFKELLWFIKGEGDITDLAKSKVRVWDKWALKYALEGEFSEVTKLGFADVFELAEQVKAETDGHTKLVDYLIADDIPFIIPLPYTDMTAWKTCKGMINQMDWAVTGLKREPDRKHYVVSSWNPERLYQMADEVGEESVVIAACHWSHVLNAVNGVLHFQLNIR